jgi:prephenate dehydrogenase
MAGKEVRGAAAADPDLFQGRTWVLTPRHPEEMTRAEEFRCWVEKAGAIPVVMDPAEHDRVVALTSHLPQLLSTELAAALGSALNLLEDARAAGPAVTDLTRLALSPFDIWRDILATNSGNIRRALDTYIDALQQCREALGDESVMAEEFERAARAALLLRRG